MGWLKIQKLEYFENGTLFFYEIKKFLICVSDHTFWELSFCSRGYIYITKIAYLMKKKVLHKNCLFMKNNRNCLSNQIKITNLMKNKLLTWEE